jgi:hypothetical protein
VGAVQAPLLRHVFGRAEHFQLVTQPRPGIVVIPNVYKVRLVPVVNAVSSPGRAVAAKLFHLGRCMQDRCWSFKNIFFVLLQQDVRRIFEFDAGCGR